jgi:hypothetical protein
MKSKPDPKIMKACRAIRKKCSKATEAQRKADFERGLAIIEKGRKASEIPLFDSVLASQLRAYGCSFNLTLSPHYGVLLHIGAPESFWTEPKRLLDLIKVFYPQAEFALSDAEGCISIVLSGLP